jgi:hypothetical protein
VRDGFDSDIHKIVEQTRPEDDPDSFGGEK